VEATRWKAGGRQSHKAWGILPRASTASSDLCGWGQMKALLRLQAGQAAAWLKGLTASLGLLMIRPQPQPWEARQLTMSLRTLGIRRMQEGEEEEEEAEVSKAGGHVASSLLSPPILARASHTCGSASTGMLSLPCRAWLTEKACMHVCLAHMYACLCVCVCVCVCMILWHVHVSSGLHISLSCFSVACQSLHRAAVRDEGIWSTGVNAEANEEGAANDEAAPFYYTPLSSPYPSSHDAHRCAEPERGGGGAERGSLESASLRSSTKSTPGRTPRAVEETPRSELVSQLHQLVSRLPVSQDRLLLRHLR
jgi:hypothetical protein